MFLFIIQFCFSCLQYYFLSLIYDFIKLIFIFTSQYLFKVRLLWRLLLILGLNCNYLVSICPTYCFTHDLDVEVPFNSLSAYNLQRESLLSIYYTTRESILIDIDDYPDHSNSDILITTLVEQLNYYNTILDRVTSHSLNLSPWMRYENISRVRPTDPDSVISIFFLFIYMPSLLSSYYYTVLSIIILCYLLLYCVIYYYTVLSIIYSF